MTATERDNHESQTRNISGRLLLEQRVGDRTGIVEFIPTRISTGMHIASLVYDGIPVAHAKINLLR